MSFTPAQLNPKVLLFGRSRQGGIGCKLAAREEMPSGFRKLTEEPNYGTSLIVHHTHSQIIVKNTIIFTSLYAINEIFLHFLLQIASQLTATQVLRLFRRCVVIGSFAAAGKNCQFWKKKIVRPQRMFNHRQCLCCTSKASIFGRGRG